MREKKKVYLQFQLVEKPEPDKMFSKDQNISYSKQTDTANYGNMEFEEKGWVLFELSDFNEHIKTLENYGIKVMKPPLQNPKIYEINKE